jgi:hypothetical protein
MVKRIGGVVIRATRGSVVGLTAPARDRLADGNAALTDQPVRSVVSIR